MLAVGASSQSGSEEGRDTPVSPSRGIRWSKPQGIRRVHTLEGRTASSWEGSYVLCLTETDNRDRAPVHGLARRSGEVLSNRADLASGRTRGCSTQCGDEPGGRQSEGHREDAGE